MQSQAPSCTGSATFNLALSDSAFSEWPDNLPGLICKTPPVGYYNAARFAECCSGPVYNITTPTSPDHPAYPVTCAQVCQVDPKLDESNDRYPYGFSEYFMCLSNGRAGTSDEAPGGEVVCAIVTVPGVEMPTSYPSGWTGDWQTRSYYQADGLGGSWTWVADGERIPTSSSTSREDEEGFSSTATTTESTASRELETTPTAEPERTSMTDDDVDEATATTETPGETPAETTGDEPDGGMRMHFTTGAVLSLALLATVFIA